VGLFWDVAADVIAQLRAADILVVHQVGSLEQALAAQAAGAQALIVQGVEAGGHVAGRQPLARLLAQVLPNVDIPVAAAGGLADGADVARVLAQGAQAAVLGTALLATQESFAHAYHKQRVVEAGTGDTVLTEDFHLNWPPHAAVRVLRNSVTEGRHGDPHTQPRQAIGEEAGRPIHLFSTDSPLSSMTGDFEAMALYAGLGVGRIHDLPPAGERVAQLLDQARAAWPAAQAEAERERTRQATLIERLNELLEAERAGVRVAAHALDQAPDAETRALLDLIHRDEVRWCVMLRGAIRQLHGRPSTHTGDFHRKAIAIEDLNERLAFLNRGQGWVAKKLRDLLPEVDDPVLNDDLARMLAAHRENLDRVNEHLAD
jgi:nitronate monooxygenase